MAVKGGRTVGIGDTVLERDVSAGGSLFKKTLGNEQRLCLIGAGERKYSPVFC